jgi:hypothetical protein
MGITINFGSQNALDGASSKQIPLKDFYDIIAEERKRPGKIDEILADPKYNALDDDAKEFIKQFIQYAKKNKIFDHLKEDDASTDGVDEFRQELVKFVTGKKAAKGNAPTISFNDTFSADSTTIDPDRKDKVINFDKTNDYRSALQFLDEDGDLSTKEKVVEEDFIFDESIFRKDTEKLYTEAFLKYDYSKPNYLKIIEPITAKLQQGLKLSDKEIKDFARELDIDKEKAQELTELIKYKYYQARKEAYDESGKSPKSSDDALTRYLLMEPSGSMEDFNYRYLGKASISPIEFQQRKLELATDETLQEKFRGKLTGNLITVDSQNNMDKVVELAKQYDPNDEMYVEARFEIARIAEEIAKSADPSSLKDQINEIFNTNILLEDIPEKDRARTLLAIDGLLSDKPAAARVMKEDVIKDTPPTIEAKMEISDLKHLSSTRDWLVWLKSSQNMDALPAELKSNSRELLEKLTKFEDLDYSDLVKFSKLLHMAGENDPQTRMVKAHDIIRNIYAERQDLIDGEVDLQTAGLNPEVATQYRKNFELAKIFNQLSPSQRSELEQLISGENLHEASQKIDQKSDFAVLQDRQIQDLIAKLESQKDIFRDVLKGTQSQQQKEWLNIIQALSRFKGNDSFDLKGKTLAQLSSMQRLKERNPASSRSNKYAAGNLTGTAEIEALKKEIDNLISSLEGKTKSEKLADLKQKFNNQGISPEAYALIPLLLDEKGDSLLQKYLKDYNLDSIEDFARIIRDEAYFQQGNAKDIKTLLQLEDGKEVEIPSFDLDTRETTPANPVTGQGGGQNLFNNFSRGIYAAFDENGIFSEEKFNEILKKVPELVSVFQSIDPTTTKEDVVSAFRGIKLDPNAPFMAPYLFQYAINQLLSDLEEKYDDGLYKAFSILVI